MDYFTTRQDRQEPSTSSSTYESVSLSQLIIAPVAAHSSKTHVLATPPSLTSFRYSSPYHSRRQSYSPPPGAPPYPPPSSQSDSSSYNPARSPPPRPNLSSPSHQTSPSIPYLPQTTPPFPNHPHSHPASLTPSHSLSARGGHSNSLPSFERWSPTWQSGGYSADGRAYTNHPPRAPPSARSVATAPARYEPARPTTEEEERPEQGFDLGWTPTRGEWAEDALFDERAGVGFGSIASGSTKKQRERLKRLEKEFGVDSFGEGVGRSIKERMNAAKEEERREKREGKVRSGVDGKGRLVIDVGRKKRVVLRWGEAIGAICVGFGSIGASLLTKPKEKPSQAGSAPLIALYILPFLSLFLTLYLFLIRPRLHRSSPSPHNPMSPYQQTQPTQTSSGCCGTSRKPSQGRYQPNPNVVNLVVDASTLPHLFHNPAFPAETFKKRSSSSKEDRKKRHRRRMRRRQRERRDDEASSDLLSSSSSSTTSSSDSSDAWSDTSACHRTSHPRKSILSSLTIETKWRSARSWHLKLVLIDLSCAVLWATVGIWAIMNGGKCPSGSGEGWCNYYNTALAFTILTAVMFLLSFGLGLLDLKRTKVSPRLIQQRAPRGGGGGVV